MGTLPLCTEMSTPFNWALTNPLYAYGIPAFLFDTVLSQYSNGLAATTNFSTLSGLTFTRASTGYAQTSAGVWTNFSSGTPRITDKGLLIEGARTNLFLNSLAPATQTITLGSTGSYTITCFDAGTAAVAAGTATISGAGTASPGSPVTINCTVIGTITVTISGSPFCVNVEAGAFGSSPIATAGASATRAADVASIAASITAPYSMFAEVNLPTVASGGQVYIGVSDGTGNNGSAIYNSGSALVVLNKTSGANDAVVVPPGTISVSTVSRLAARYQTNNITGSFMGGTVGTIDTTCTVSSRTQIELGTSLVNAVPMFGYLKRAAIDSNLALTDGQLQGWGA